MKKITIKKTLCMSLIASISLPAYAADNNTNQKRTAGTVDEQNTAATLMQAGARGALARREQQNESPKQNKSMPHAESTQQTTLQRLTTRQAELERRATQQAETNTAATLIQAGARGALARYEALAMPVQQNNAFFGTIQLTNATPTPQRGTYSSRSSESSESSEDSDIEPEENIEARDQNGDTPLIAAAKAGQIEQVRTLIARGADVNFVDEYHATALIWTAQAGHTNILHTLLGAYADVNITDANGNTPLLVAAHMKRVEMVPMLIYANADINIPDNNNNTPLMCAAKNKDIRIAQMLIIVKANVNAVNKHHVTALHHATNKGRIKIVRTLIASGANVNLTDENGEPPLINAIIHGFNKIAQMLIAAKANIDVTTNNGMPLLAFSLEFPEITQLLVDAYRAQLAKQHHENLIAFFPEDLIQFYKDPIDGDITLLPIGSAFNEVGEVITRNMSDDDRRTLKLVCKLFRKAAINGKNIQSHAQKIESFSRCIRPVIEKLKLLKKEYVDDEKFAAQLKAGISFLQKELDRGYYIRESEPACALRQQTIDIKHTANSEPTCALKQQATIDAQQEMGAVCAVTSAVTLEEERALRATQNAEYEQSLAIDCHIAALENQIVKLTEQAHALIAQDGYGATVAPNMGIAPNIAEAPLDFRQQARDLYTDIIAARTKLIGLIQSTQTFDEIFAQAKAARLVQQKTMLAGEQAHLRLIQSAIDDYVPTREEIRATREQYERTLDGDGRHGKNTAR